LFSTVKAYMHAQLTYSKMGLIVRHRHGSATSRLPCGFHNCYRPRTGQQNVDGRHRQRRSLRLKRRRALQGRPGNAGQCGASGVVRASAPLSLASRRPSCAARVTEDGRRVSRRRCRRVHCDRCGRSSSATAVVAVCGGHPFYHCRQTQARLLILGTV